MASIYTFKHGKLMHKDKMVYANGEEFVLLKDYEVLEDRVEKLKCELDKTYNQLMEVEKESQERIAELESELEVKDNLLKIKNGLLGNNDELPTDPIEVAQMLINSTYEYELSALDKALYKCGDTRTTERYSIDDLEQIAEHLLVYCKHNRESEE